MHKNDGQKNIKFLHSKISYDILATSFEFNIKYKILHSMQGCKSGSMKKSEMIQKLFAVNLDLPKYYVKLSRKMKFQK